MGCKSCHVDVSAISIHAISIHMMAVVLAGGLGTRLRPVVRDRPKSMAEIAGRPFLEYLLLLLRRQNVHDVVLCTGYMSESVQRHFGSGVGLGVSLRYSEEARPLGTGGALKLAEPMLEDTRWLVLNGNSFFPVPLEALVQSHVDRKSVGTLALSRVSEAGRYGSVTLGNGGLIQAFAEKAAAGQRPHQRRLLCIRAADPRFHRTWNNGVARARRLSTTGEDGAARRH